MVLIMRGVEGALPKSWEPVACLVSMLMELYDIKMALHQHTAKVAVVWPRDLELVIHSPTALALYSRLDGLN